MVKYDAFSSLIQSLFLPKGSTLHYIKTSLYLSSKEPQNVFKGKSIWEPVGILMQKWQTVKPQSSLPEETHWSLLPPLLRAVVHVSTCLIVHERTCTRHHPGVDRERGHTWLLCQTGGSSSGGRRAWLVTARLLVRSPGFLLARVSRCPRARRPHLNCSRRAGRRLAWPTPPRVCEWMHERVSDRQYRKAL